jgi:hypothetical protein
MYNRGLGGAKEEEEDGNSRVIRIEISACILRNKWQRFQARLGVMETHT